MKIKSFFVYGALTLGLFYLVSSCNKKKDTIGKVYVYDENKNAMSGVTVIIKAEPSESSVGKEIIEPDTAITNATGEAIFNFNELYQLGQAGVAVLNIYASKDQLSGEGIIQIVEEETAETDVVIKP